MKKNLITFAAVIAALSLAGCSAGGIAPTNGPETGGFGGSGSSGAAVGSSRYEGSDIGGRKESFIDKIGGIFDGSTKDIAGTADEGYFTEAEATAPSGGYAGAVAEFAVGLEPAGQFGNVGRRQQVGGGGASLAVHAHVQRGIGAEREAP